MSFESTMMGVPRLVPPPWAKQIFVNALSPEYTSATDTSPYSFDLSRAIADASGGILFFPDATYAIAVNVEFPSDVAVMFAPGAMLDIAVGVTVTVNGQVHAGASRWISGDGSVVFGGKVAGVYAEWWGAIADRVTDCIDAFDDAALSLSASGGGVIFCLPGGYVISRKFVTPPNVRVVGAALQATQFLWTGAAGFGIRLGNSSSVLSYGTGLSDLSVIISESTAHGIEAYGVADCNLRNIYVEGVPSTPTSIGVQIDGADVSAFFILMENVHCNHIFRGFVHTTTGTVQPTQVTGINCCATCDNTPGSVGIDVETVGGVGCGDGVNYIGGNMEACATGVSLNATGSTIIGMRFENQQGVASDVTFGALARNNQVVGGAGLFTLTDNAHHPTNQVVAVPKDMVTNASQMNRLDAVLLSGDTTIQKPPSGGGRYFLAEDTNDGFLLFQNGPGSAATGGSVILYGQNHATHPNDVVVGSIGGKFRINGNALDGGTDFFVVDLTTGLCTVNRFEHAGTTLGFYGTAGVAKPNVTGSRGGNAALASLITALASQGLVTNGTTA